MIISMKNFYTFHSCGYGTTFAAFPGRADQLISCNKSAAEYLSRLILGDYNEVQLPVIYNEIKGGSSGKKMRDILDTRYPPLYLISDRFKNVLEECGITGWKSYPITLFDKKGNRVEGYNGFSITGRAGKIQKFVQFQTQCDYSADTEGYYFDIDTWDGSDLFNTEGSWHIIASERFIKVLVENKITACEYCRLADYGDMSKIKRIH